MAHQPDKRNRDRTSETATENPITPDPIAENIDAAVALQERAESRAGFHQHAVERGTAWIGRPAVLYSVFAATALWIGYNVAAPRFGLHPFDPPPFSWLDDLASYGGLLIALTVLITQNRQARMAERRAQLDLQINLLSERKTTKIIDLLEELRRDLPNVQNRRDAEAEVLTRSIDPHAVVEALELKMESDATDQMDELAE